MGEMSLSRDFNIFVTPNFAHFLRPNRTADIYAVWFIRRQSQVIALDKNYKVSR